MTWFINCVSEDLEDLDLFSEHLEHLEPDEPLGSLSEEEQEDPQGAHSVEALTKTASNSIISSVQKNSRCFAINWRPSRMAFLVKRCIGDVKASREFFAGAWLIKKSKRARKHLAHPEQTPGQALQVGFDACLKSIVSWLDETPAAPSSENIIEQDPPLAA